MPKLGRPKGHYTQYRRLSQLREMLEAHPKGLSMIEIAKKLHVTDRSVRRYLRELEREVDIERKPDPDGLGGVVVLIPTRDLPRRVKLHRTQIYGLLMARRVFRMLDGTTFEAALRQGVDQLLSHVQRAPRRGAEIDPDTRLEDRFLYLPSAPMKPLGEEASEILDTMLDACAQLRVCTITYRKGTASSRETEQLTVHPYAIVIYKDLIYCVGHVRERDAIRTLRTDRMLDADADPLQHFALPTDFSVDAYFQGQFGVHTSGARTRVVIDFDPRVVDSVTTRRFPGENGQDATCEPLAGGGCRLTMEVGNTAEVLSWLLSFGETARVVEPAALAEEAARTFRAAAALYDAPGAQDAGVPKAKNARAVGRAGRRNAP